MERSYPVKCVRCGKELRVSKLLLRVGQQRPETLGRIARFAHDRCPVTRTIVNAAAWRD
jgi:hypothetical protein